MNFFEKDSHIKDSTIIYNKLPEIGIESARAEILEGLNSIPKYISPKFFYNEAGSTLFEEITKLEEYYPTRSEKEILSKLIPNLDIDFENIDIIELGSGDASKISLVLAQLSPSILESVNYYALDIDQSAIEKSIAHISDVYQINCTGIVTDFYHHLEISPSDRKRLFCFFGSTIGNFNPSDAEVFMKQLGALMKMGDCLLLGTDLIKDISVLEQAYNDKEKITDAFNKNILLNVNTLIESDFSPRDFDHIAFYNEAKSRIEMHLKSRRDLKVKSKYAPLSIKIKKGEAIHTENSHKFNIEQLTHFGNMADLVLEKILFDTNKYFGLTVYKKQ